MERVVVTGLGAVSSVGIGVNNFWSSLLSGSSGFSQISAFDTVGLRNRVASEIKNFNPNDFVSPNTLKQYGRASQYAVVASTMALVDGGFSLRKRALFDIDVIIGTTMGEIQALEQIDTDWIEEGEGTISGDLIARYPSNNIAMSVSHEIGSVGRSIVIPTACAAGNYAIGYGLDLIKNGQSSMVLAGGAEAFSRIAYTGFSRMLAMAETVCSPFDKNRKGMILGEGAGFLLLESLSCAKKRNAKIYAEVAGYGLSCDAEHMTIPDKNGIVRAISNAIKESGVSLEEIDYICAHGTGTPANDEAECAAISHILGDRSKSVPVSSIKSMIGHAMGAASALEAIACCMSIQSNQIPPTINFKDYDEACPVDCVPNISRKGSIGVVLNNSFAFGGNNSCVVFKKFNDSL